MDSKNKNKKSDDAGVDEGWIGGISSLGAYLDETNEKAVFQRRSSISRTPPQSTSSGPVREAGGKEEQWIDEDISTSPIYKLQGDKQRIPQDNEDSQRTKRKRMESPGSSEKLRTELYCQRDNYISEVTKVITKLTKRSHELRKLVGESTKTKLEIKRVVRELDHIVGNLENKWGKFQETESCLNDRRYQPAPTETEQSAETQAGSKSTENQKTMLTVGTQTDWQDAELERTKKDNEMREVIKQTMVEVKSFQNLTKIIDIPWPGDMFISTQIQNTSPSINSEGDVAIMIEPGGTDTNGTLEKLSMRYPAVIDMARKNEGHIDYLTSTTVTKIRNKETEEKTTTVYVLPLKVNKDGINDMQEAYNVLKELKDTYRRHPSGRLNLILLDGLDLEYMRKICEYVFANDQLNIVLISRKVRQVPKGADNRKPTIERVIVKSGNTSYADLLKSVKDKVDLNRVGVQVKTIKKTRQGDLLLEVSGDRQKAGALKEAISKKIENKVSLINNETTIHVLDIDAALTVEDVEKTIKSFVGSREAQTIRVKSIRPSRDGNQIATVQASRAASNALVKEGRIKIGWVGCRVRERVEVIRCFKCLEFGHRKKDCKGEDRSSLCLNCNQEGHQAKGCVNEQFCTACREVGHRADSTKCVKFRELLKAQSAARRQAGRPTITHD